MDQMEENEMPFFFFLLINASVPGRSNWCSSFKEPIERKDLKTTEII